ncbi:MAG: hypothetical protein NVV63_03015 [Opitutus sp.]|nr:hypothetical protein [Opitutus sp.]
MPTTLTIGEFRSRISEALALVQKGESVIVTNGRNKRPVAIFAPPLVRRPRKLGRLAGKAHVTIEPNWEMTDEELCGS